MRCWQSLGRIASTVACLVLLTASAVGQTRYVTEGGITYRETRRRVYEPVYETAYVPSPAIGHAPGATPAYREQIQTTWVPETHDQTQTRWRPVAGFFSPRVPVQACVPTTVWRPQTRSVPVPLPASAARGGSFATVAHPTVRYVEREVVTRTPVGPVGWLASRPSAAASQPPWRLGWHPLQGWAWNRQPVAAPLVYPGPTPLLAPPPTYAVAPVPSSSIVPVSYTAANGGWRASTR